MRDGRRVVVTGIGIVSPLGNDACTFWRRLERGETGIAPVGAFDASECAAKVAAEVSLPASAAAGPLAKVTRRSSRLAVAAATAALADARLAAPADGGAGLYLATLPWEIDHPAPLCVGEDGEVDLSRTDPQFLFRHVPNNAGYAVAAALGLRGPVLGIASACAAGTIAIGEGYQAVRRGEFDWALAGGTCAPVTPLGMVGLTLIRALSTRADAGASRPFDARRDGFVLGEGAALLVLEEAAHALARGARLYGEVAGYGGSMDGGRSLADPDPTGEGACRAIRAALRSAGCAPDEVDCIKAHGTSTRANDRIESLAIRSVFGARAELVPVTAPKSMLGHSLAAAGAIEAVAALGVLCRGVIPPTINYESPDPECDLDYVPNVARPQAVETMLLNSFGMGGQNACLVLRRAAPGG